MDKAIGGIFWSIDAMAVKREWLSPYNMAQNNPINRIDPDGNLDDYALRDNGTVELTKETNDNFDRLTASNGNSITVNKATPESGTIISQLSKKDKDGFSVGKTSNLGDAKKVFDFANQNTTKGIEFGLAGYNKSGSNEYSVSTLHQNSGTNYSKLGIKPTDLIFYIHNHDGGTSPSNDDFNSATKIANEVGKKTYDFPKFFTLPPNNYLEEYDPMGSKGLPRLNYSLEILKSIKKYNYNERAKKYNP